MSSTALTTQRKLCPTISVERWVPLNSLTSAPLPQEPPLPGHHPRPGSQSNAHYSRRVYPPKVMVNHCPQGAIRWTTRRLASTSGNIRQFEMGLGGTAGSITLFFRHCNLLMALLSDCVLLRVLNFRCRRIVLTSWIFLFVVSELGLAVQYT